MKAGVISFVGDQIVVEEGNALSGHSQFRWVHNLLSVEVSDKLVAIGSHCFDICLELSLGKVCRLQQAVEERSLVSDNFSPVVLAVLVAKEFAPLQNANVEKVPVGIYPKLVLEYEFAFPPAGLVEG